MLSKYEHHLPRCCKEISTLLNLNNGMHATVCVLVPDMFFVDLFSSVWPLTLCYTLYVLSRLEFALSQSLPSKCWYISFKWSVFISHSLFPLLPPISLHSLRRSWVCLRGINPQTSTSLLLLFLSFSPSPFLLLHLSHPTFIVSGWMSAHIYPRQLFDCQTVAYCRFPWNILL